MSIPVIEAFLDSEKMIRNLSSTLKKLKGDEKDFWTAQLSMQVDKINALVSKAV